MASIVKGNMDFISFARYTLGAYALVFVVTPVVTYFFKEWGAVMAMALFFVAPLFSYLLLNARRPFLHFGGRVDLPALREQFSFGLAQIYQDALTHVMRIVIAAWIVHGLGLSTLGIYQVVMTFTTVYMSIPIQATSGYVLPLIAGARNNEEVGTALNDSVRFLMFALVPIVIFIAVVPELLILLCYSKDFEPAVPYLQVQLIGTLFVLMGYSYSAALSGKGKLKAIAIISSIYCGIMLGVARLLFPRWGLMGVSVGVSAAAVANYLMHIYAARHYFGARTAPKNVRLVSMTLLWAGLAFVGLAFFDGIASRALILAFAPVWFWVSSKDHERHFMWELAGRCFKSFFRKGVPLVQKPVS
jgi:O-antigen/teichoic acid export membrane protein